MSAVEVDRMCMDTPAGFDGCGDYVRERNWSPRQRGRHLDSRSDLATQERALSTDDGTIIGWRCIYPQLNGIVSREEPPQSDDKHTSVANSPYDLVKERRMETV